jgi:hypothetical protein
MNMARWRLACDCAAFAFMAIFCADTARADALVITKAMQASTIAEIFIEPTQIRVEIEVGVDDLTAFANILPDWPKATACSAAEDFPGARLGDSC